MYHTCPTTKSQAFLIKDGRSDGKFASSLPVRVLIWLYCSRSSFHSSGVSYLFPIISSHFEHEKSGSQSISVIGTTFVTNPFEVLSRYFTMSPSYISTSCRSLWPIYCVTSTLE